MIGCQGNWFGINKKALLNGHVEIIRDMYECTNSSMTNVRTVKWHLDFSFWNVTPMSLLTRYSFLCHLQAPSVHSLLAHACVHTAHFHVPKLPRILWTWPIKANPNWWEKAQTMTMMMIFLWRIFSRSFYGSLIVESDSYNAISWVSHDSCKPWKFPFYFNEIKPLVSRLQLVLQA